MGTKRRRKPGTFEARTKLPPGIQKRSAIQAQAARSCVHLADIVCR
jgi:hypothetical protein